MSIRKSGRTVRQRGRELLRRFVKSRLYRPTKGRPRHEHLRAAADWLARAQDYGTNRGISVGALFGKGFGESYPETTGYIIPTFLTLAKRFDEPRWRERAIEAAHWECEVQMREGAVMGSTLNSNPSPAVFNTGMVLLGWAALIRETNEPRFRQSAQRACDWMLSMQDPDGFWRKGNSKYCRPEMTLYNVKAAWGLCEAGQALGHTASIEGAVRNGEYTLTQQSPNGWYANCCLWDAEHPLLHTIAYTMQGLLGIARLTGRKDFIVSAAKCANAVLVGMKADGFIAGRWDKDFKPSVDWCCLTGSAQTAIVWSQLYEITHLEKYREATHRVCRYLVAHHDITSKDPSIRGGVPGSWPVHGGYDPYFIQNWATNFFLEALLCEDRIQG